MSDFVFIILFYGIGYTFGRFSGGVYKEEEILKTPRYCKSTQIQGKDYKRCWDIKEVE